MADPRTQLTAQELVYAAKALRAEARERAARAYDDLADKVTRIAEALSAPRGRR